MSTPERAGCRDKQGCSQHYHRVDAAACSGESQPTAAKVSLGVKRIWSIQSVLMFVLVAYPCIVGRVIRLCS
jgi:hypothetical protein